MEQEVPVTIKSGTPFDSEKSALHEAEIPDQVREIGDTLAEALARFRKSQYYDQILKGTESAKEYIRKNPVPAILYSVGAGTLIALLMRKKR